MKKVLLLIVLSQACIQGLSAVSIKGKIGLGCGTTRFGNLLEPSLFATRYGISEKILIEPWLDISKVSFKVSYPGEFDEFESKLSFQNTGFGLQTLYAFRSGEKSNLYGIGGVTFGTIKLKSETKYDIDQYTLTSPITYLVIPLGIGGEHFLINEYLSVNINAKFGYAISSGELRTADEILANYDISLFNLGNSLFTLYFMWYF